MTRLGKTYQSVNSFNFSLFLRKGAVAVRGDHGATAQRCAMPAAGTALANGREARRL